MKNLMRDRRAQERSGPSGEAVRTTENRHRVEWLFEKLKAQVEAVEADADASTIDKARTVGYLANPILKAIEVGGMASRLQELENLMDRLQEKTS